MIGLAWVTFYNHASGASQLGIDADAKIMEVLLNVIFEKLVADSVPNSRFHQKNYSVGISGRTKDKIIVGAIRKTTDGSSKSIFKSLQLFFRS